MDLAFFTFAVLEIISAMITSETMAVAIRVSRRVLFGVLMVLRAVRLGRVVIGSVLPLVEAVLAAGSVHQIGQTRVHPVSVEVSYFLVSRAWAKEGRSNEDVNAAPLWLAAAPQLHGHVAVRIRPPVHEEGASVAVAPFEAAHAPLGRY